LLPDDDIPSGIFLPEVFERFRASLYEFIHMHSYIIQIYTYEFIHEMNSFIPTLPTLLQHACRTNFIAFSSRQAGFDGPHLPPTEYWGYLFTKA
jgi:hypothetical protein